MEYAFLFYEQKNINLAELSGTKLTLLGLCNYQYLIRKIILRVRRDTVRLPLPYSFQLV